MNLLPALALLPLLSFSTPAALAQQAGAQCTTIANNAERLACLDAAFAAPDVAGGVAEVIFQSEQLIPAYPSGRAPATITVACEADKLTVAFGFAGNSMSTLGRDAGITWQLDLQAARSRTLPVNADNTAVVLNTNQDALAFIQSLQGVQNLTVRITPVNVRSLRVRFSVSDFAAQIEPVREACGV